MLGEPHSAAASTDASKLLNAFGSHTGKKSYGAIARTIKRAQRSFDASFNLRTALVGIMRHGFGNELLLCYTQEVGSLGGNSVGGVINFERSSHHEVLLEFVR